MGDETTVLDRGRTTTRDKSSTAVSPKVERFWAGMLELFGQRWVTSYGTTPTTLWTSAVSSLSAKELKTILHRMLTSGAQHPPTLPELVAFAREPGDKPSRFPEPFTPEWNDGRKAVLAKIAKQSADRGVTFTPEQRFESNHALALAELTTGMLGFEEARAAYQRDGDARLARLTGHAV